MKVTADMFNNKDSIRESLHKVEKEKYNKKTSHKPKTRVQRFDELSIKTYEEK